MGFFLVDLSCFDMSPMGFLAGSLVVVSDVLGAIFHFFSTFYFLGPRNLRCKSSSLKNVGVSSLNRSGGNSLDVQNRHWREGDPKLSWNSEGILGSVWDPRLERRLEHGEDGSPLLGNSGAAN